jgi:hypothetical protein
MRTSMMLALGVFAGATGLATFAQNPPVVIGKIVRKPVAKKVDAKSGKSDVDILTAAKLKADDPAALLKYFRSRTLTDDQIKAIRNVIVRFADDRFAVREKASDELLAFGAAALGPLKNAIATESDPEVVYRCDEARKRIETVSQATVAVAAARQLALLKSPEASAALLAFLPTADSEIVAEEIRKTLVPLALRDGKLDPAIAAALADSSPVRRGAAAVALAEGARTPDAVAKVKAMLAGEKDAEVRFAAFVALVASSKAADQVPGLIALLPELPRGRLWQAEDLLLQLAGDTAPKARYGKTRDTIEKFRDEWLAWWKANESKVKLDSFAFAPRTDGCLLLVEWNNQGWGNGQVTLLGPNLKPRATLTNLMQPMDAVLLPGDRIAVAEQNNSRVTIRNFANEIVTTIQDNQPIGLQHLESGKLFVSNRNGAAEFDLDGTKGWTYSRPNNNHDVMGARRLGNGETIFFVNSDQKNNCLRIDAKGKDVGKPFALGQPYYNPAIESIGTDDILVADQSKIQLYSLKENKVTWSHPVNNVTSLQRLPNGNYLYVVQNSNKVVEITPAKEEVWEHQISSGMRLARAYRK